MLLVCCVVLPSYSQRVLSLDDCRAMALQNNRQLQSATLNQQLAENIRKAARTKYLPKVDAVGGYEWTSKEISLLNKDQKSALSNLGTNASSSITSSVSDLLQNLVASGMISAEVAQQLGGLASNLTTPLSQYGDAFGTQIKNAFRTDTRNLWTAAIMLRQPIYMGGAITAANKIADIGEQLAASGLDLKRQETIYSVEQTYWTVVSLRQKEQLALSFRDLVKKLDDDVHKMIREGVATRADGLRVDVKVNEAEMQITQAQDGLALAKMLLCQLCGIDMNENITLADENSESVNVSSSAISESDSITSRPEIRMLQNAADISDQNVKLIRAAYLPHVALTGGYLLTNPNVYNGFEKKFAGVWNIGVLVQVPLWNWFEGSYKIKAAQTAAQIARLEVTDLEEKINLQVAQSRYKLSEAVKRSKMANENLKSAEENLRCANLGYKEGVMELADVMAAQTAWQAAQSQKIDAEIAERLAQSGLQKALGNLK